MNQQTLVDISLYPNHATADVQVGVITFSGYNRWKDNPLLIRSFWAWVTGWPESLLWSDYVNVVYGEETCIWPGCPRRFRCVST